VSLRDKKKSICVHLCKSVSYKKLCVLCLPREICGSNSVAYLTGASAVVNKTITLQWEKIMKTIQTQVPEQIYEKALDLVKQGWFRDEQDIFYEAIRRYLDSHRPDLMEKFIREDVEWGLHGND